jgi:hypothetical protein
LVTIVAFAAKRQFGQTPSIAEIYGNMDTLYVAGKNKPVYIYFFNQDEAAVREITDGTNTYSLGDEIVLLEDEMDSWAGAGFETAPVNWQIYSSDARTATWRLYEAVAGEGTWILNGGTTGDYFGLRNDTIQWTKGDNVWLKVRYKGGGAGVYMGAMEKALYGFTVAATNNLPLPFSAGYTEVEVKFHILTADWLVDGPRIPFVVLFVPFPAADVLVEIDTITIVKLASSIGYYRLKVDDLEVDTTYQFKEGVTVLATKIVRVKPFCTGYRYIKFLDRNGQYRFYPFNSRWESKDAPKKIGKINQLITNILTDQTDSKNVGYTNERKITLVADDVLNDELEILSDIYTSPRVYLEIGDGTTDGLKDWLQVDISSSDNLIRRKKGSTSTVKLTVTLPEWYNITML